MPGERRFILPLIQEAERTTVFHKAPEPSRAEPVGLGFGERPVAPIGESETRSHDRVGRAVGDGPEAPDEKVRHGSQ